MMILRYSTLTNLPFLLLLLLHSVLAEDFDCKPTLEGRPYDLTSLGNGEHVVNRTRDTPPTQMIDSLAFDLCGDLKAKETLSEQDQCPAGTRACLTQVNVKEKVERVVSVIPLAQSSKLDPQLTVSSKTPEYLTLLFHGPEYPQPPAEQQSLAAPSQSLNLTLWCDPQLETPKITILGYDGSQLQLEYFGIAGCPTSNGTNPPDEGKDPDGGDKEPTGSGIGWFFLLLLLAFVAYFSIGAYYNYSTYGARGMDLIPHRDFWQEVPYMLRDVVSHMCSSARPRRSTRGGYISV
ncbi:autophagy-related protein 27 [Ephemerocybe angulata]|uniref:Autophagy-related protein 27 n=1 Tax=Ephemerocybe angulata TaxID=980116 RepID=A0A8H6MBE2_9AGAR|nr:autophagy-related protein 27 [Tulosesus angulatus]